MDLNEKKIDVLTIGYYADFARFFDLIAKRSLQINSKLTFQHINLHLSGQVYSFIHRQKAFYLPYRAHKTKSDKNNLSSQEKAFYRQFISYHIRLVPKINEDELILQARKYFNYLKFFFDKTQPKLIILSGDSRMPAEIILFLAREMGVKIIHFEQAPLGRTILDPQGVNANCSFKDANVFASHTQPVKPVNFVRRKKWQGYKKYRAIDILVEKFAPSLQSIEHKRPVRKVVDNQCYQLATTKSYKLSEIAGKKIFLLVLQVPDDVNMIYHSPWFSNHFDIVKAVYHALPDDSILIIREHPLYKRLYEDLLYIFIGEHKNVFFDQSDSLNQAISNCKVVVVNNSTVGLEAIELGKPVVVLGNAYYDECEFCIKYQGKDLKGILRAALDMPSLEGNKREKYLSFLFNDMFIDGHFRDVDGPAPDNIAKWINNNVV
ncbi:hypothetical protein LQ939_12550 [Pantoea alhagi]|uniref:capsular polysaccharide export protein, LipB/KpsS family n=1 Tax=Pantoea alhagi TaxID=1891675 RepID=UPI00202B1972|nr:hypothetical protein [Pantoea alhagi]URQ59610.1 hypothetical protein LQ939_12550 [Pantoea alhagi]